MDAASPCQFLEWDSAFFGCRVARIRAHRLAGSEMERALAWCMAEGIDALYLLADPRDSQTIRLAEVCQFGLMDLRVTLERHLPRGGQGPAGAAPIRPVAPEDLAALRAIARVSHQDSRFYADPRLCGRAGALFETWIESCCQGRVDAVLVAERSRRPVGYIACQKVTPSQGQIDLIAVAPGWQRQGLGQALVEAALRWFAQREIDHVQVVTQGKNELAQRLYQRCGFLTQSVQLWYHRWLRPGLSGPARAG